MLNILKFENQISGVVLLSQLAIFNGVLSELTHFMSLVSFYTFWKHQKTRVFYVFRGYRKRPVTWNRLSNGSKSEKWCFCSGLKISLGCFFCKVILIKILAINFTQLMSKKKHCLILSYVIHSKNNASKASFSSLT